MKKLMYIFFMMMLAVNALAQETYVIDSVCFEENRNYYIEGWEGSTFEWIITNEENYDTVYHDTLLAHSYGSTFGSEINYNWNAEGTFMITAIQTSEHGCDTIEAGMVKVFPPPTAFAGAPQNVCTTDSVNLYEAEAHNFTRVEWITLGDGVFNADTIVNPKYAPGEFDVESREVSLVLTVYGLAANGTCEPARDTIKIKFMQPEVTLVPYHLECYNDDSGWIVAFAQGAVPFTYEWTGPNEFSVKHQTSLSNDTIKNLSAG